MKMIPRKELTPSIVREALNYNPETGVFTWRFASRNGTPAGAVAGGIDSDGYVSIRLCGHLYRAHNLAWFVITGLWPDGEIDHWDTDRQNNRLSNLRDVTKAVNRQNLRRAKSTSKSGILGVKKYRDRWTARIVVKGKEIHLGVFDTAGQASAAYLEAKRELHAGCTI